MVAFDSVRIGLPVLLYLRFPDGRYAMVQTAKWLILVVGSGSNMRNSCIRWIMSCHSETLYQDRTACFGINRKISDGSYWSKRHADLCVPCLVA